MEDLNQLETKKETCPDLIAYLILFTTICMTTSSISRPRTNGHAGMEINRYQCYQIYKENQN